MDYETFLAGIWQIFYSIFTNKRYTEKY